MWGRNPFPNKGSQTLKFATKGAWIQNVCTEMGSDIQYYYGYCSDSDGQKGRLNITKVNVIWEQSVFHNVRDFNWPLTWVSQYKKVLSFMSYSCPWLDLEGLTHTHTHTHGHFQSFRTAQCYGCRNFLSSGKNMKATMLGPLDVPGTNWSVLSFFQHQHETTANIRQICLLTRSSIGRLRWQFRATIRKMYEACRSHGRLLWQRWNTPLYVCIPSHFMPMNGIP